MLSVVVPDRVLVVEDEPEAQAHTRGPPDASADSRC